MSQEALAKLLAQHAALDKVIAEAQQLRDDIVLQMQRLHRGEAPVEVELRREPSLVKH